MARKFQIKRGLKANLPALAQGEFAMTTDSGAEALWLGTGSTNKKIPLDPTAADVGAVSKTGDKMTGDLATCRDDGGYARIAAALDGAYFQSVERDDVNTRRQLCIDNMTKNDDDASAVHFQVLRGGIVTAKHNIYHAGNKPSGSYTGNGSAAVWTVDTKGIGHAIVIFSSVGNAFVTYWGGLIFSSSGGVEPLGGNSVHFRDGVLTMATDHHRLNANGQTYDYQVL